MFVKKKKIIIKDNEKFMDFLFLGTANPEPAASLNSHAIPILQGFVVLSVIVAHLDHCSRV